MEAFTELYRSFTELTVFLGDLTEFYTLEWNLLGSIIVYLVLPGFSELCTVLCRSFIGLLGLAIVLPSVTGFFSALPGFIIILLSLCRCTKLKPVFVKMAASLRFLRHSKLSEFSFSFFPHFFCLCAASCDVLTPPRRQMRAAFRPF